MDLAEKTSELISYLKKIEASQSPTTFACSFGAEDMVLLDAIARSCKEDRGFHARYGTIARRNANPAGNCARQISDCDPDLFPRCRGSRKHGSNKMARTLSTKASRSGSNAAISARSSRCSRALAGKKSWITGLRREQSAGAPDTCSSKSGTMRTA